MDLGLAPVGYANTDTKQRQITRQRMSPLKEILTLLPVPRGAKSWRRKNQLNM